MAARSIGKIALLILVLLVIACVIFYNVLIRVDPVAVARYNTGSDSVQLPYGTIVLARHDDQYGAIRIRRAASRHGWLNGAKYEAWYTDDAAAHFTGDEVEYRSDVVYERYEREEYASNGYELTDVGSRLNLKAGPFWVGWSKSNHVYARPWRGGGDEPPITDFQIAATQWTDIENVDVDDPDLQWIPQ